MRRFIFLLTIATIVSVEVSAQAVIVRKRDLNSTGSSMTNSSVRISPSSANASMNGLFYSRYSHAFKFNAASLITGELPVAYEHKTSDYLTVEGGVGVTTYNLIEDLIRGYSLRTDGETVSGLSYSALFNMKFFPEGNAFKDGYYMALNFNFRNYAQNFSPSSNLAADTTMNESFSWSDLGLTMGYHSRPSEKIMFDWYIGAGLRQKNRAISTSTSGVDSNGLLIWTYALEESSNISPAILGGLKIGLLFR